MLRKLPDRLAGPHTCLFQIIKLRIERTQYERARDELVDKRNNEQKEEDEEDEFERMGSREDRQLAYNDRQNGT